MQGSGPWHSPPIAASTPPARTEVGCELAFEIADRAAIALQVAVASTAGPRELEVLTVELDGEHLEPTEVPVDVGGRVHLVRCGAGRLRVAYRAVLVPAPPAGSGPNAGEEIVALRQSRYCPSDALDGFADLELGHLPDAPERARAIAEWVHRRIRYELGSSGPLETAVDTLLSGQGVCRDFAHLTIALCRAVGVPARLVSVYAPGLSPMDFHAVVEVAVEGHWEVVDATRLAPRQSLVRIATGRDAADTAFATTVDGSAELTEASVTAFTHGDLPVDDHLAAAAIA